MTENLEQVAERIKGLMAEKRVKAVEISRKTGIPAENISRYVNGKRLPKGNFLLDLSSYFGVTAKWLITGEGSKFSKSKNSDEVDNFSEQGDNFSSNKKISREDRMSSSQKDKLLRYQQQEIAELKAKLAKYEGEEDSKQTG